MCVVILYQTKQRDWTFPKGHVEPGESFAQTARRETKEETGLDVEVGEELGVTQYIHPNGQEISVHWFRTQSHDDAELKPEFAGGEAVWVPLDAVEARLTYASDKAFFASIKDQLG